MKNFIGVLVIVILVGVAYIIYSSPKSGILEQSVASKEPAINLAQAPIIAQTDKSEVHSPDGTVILSMKTTATRTNKSYTFYVTGGDKSNLLIFSKTLGTGEMSIPANSWSPDNKDFFITEKEGTVSSFLVFKGNGENFADGSKYIDVTALFTQKQINHGLKDVTGWDAPDLLHVQTSGPNYWFEIPSKAFIQLAS